MLVTSREEETRGYVKRGECQVQLQLKINIPLPESQTKLFDNLTLEVEKSTRVAMLGRIGSGKVLFFACVWVCTIPMMVWYWLMALI